MSGPAPRCSAQRRKAPSLTSQPSGRSSANAHGAVKARQLRYMAGREVERTAAQPGSRIVCCWVLPMGKAPMRPRFLA